jgi:SAM-dependent methyltransferase
MGQIVFDERAAETLDLMYRTRDVLRRRRLVREALAAKRGDCIVDIGCGPGFYTAELLDEVGPDGAVLAVDVSSAMLATAARRSEGRLNATFREGQATSLPAEDQSFDRAFVVQVLEYVADVPQALREMHRVLRPGGRGLVWDIDWSTLSWHSRDPARMERILHAWDRHLTYPALPRTLAPMLRAAGFEDVRVEPHVFATTELDPESFGAMVLRLIEGYVASLEDVGRDAAKEWAEEQRELGRRREFFFAMTQFCFTASKPS